MSLAALAFACGAALLQTQAALPSLHWTWVLAATALFSFRWKFFVYPTALLAGFLWAAACAHWRTADWLAPELEGRDVVVVGVVSSLPANGERSQRFEFDVASAQGVRLPSKLLLSWDSPGWGEEAPGGTVPSGHPGEPWLLT